MFLPLKMTSLAGIIQSLRPKQWIKNVFVVMPAVFAKKLSDPYFATKAACAFGIFCLLAGCVYLINDVMDVERDRHHPLKKHRPLASGKISRSTAVLSAVVILCFTMVFSAWFHPVFAGIAASYFLLHLLYSLRLKRIVILDILAIAAGFVLRVEAGVRVVEAFSSPWVTMSTLLLAIFLALAKRRGEILSVPDRYEKSREVLRQYSPQFLDSLLLIAATGAIMSYAIYTTSDFAYGKFGTYNLTYTTVFVIYGVFRYYYLIHQGVPNSNPTDLLYSDYPLLINLMLWIGACILIIGL